MLQSDTPSTNYIINADFPLSEDGRVHHLGVRKGEVRNNIITVGDIGRAWRISQLLDEPYSQLLTIHSSRGFLTISGHYKGIEVSIVAIGMGLSMSDFFVREVAQVVEGKIRLVRLGSCGSIKQDMPVGTLVLVNECALCTRNYDSFHSLSANGDELAGSQCYNISMPVKSNEELGTLVSKQAQLSDLKVVDGINITTDSFYSSQGRPSTEFIDSNTKLLSLINRQIPEALSMEMETFMLYHLAHCSKAGRIQAFALQIVFADRLNSIFINPEEAIPIELKAAKIILDSFVQ